MTCANYEQCMAGQKQLVLEHPIPRASEAAALGVYLQHGVVQGWLRLAVDVVVAYHSTKEEKGKRREEGPWRQIQ